MTDEAQTPQPNAAEDMAKGIAMTKSYTGSSVIAAVLMTLGPLWPIGFYLAWKWRAEAKQMEQRAGSKRPGQGCLGAVFWWGIATLVLWIVLLFSLMSDTDTDTTSTPDDAPVAVEVEAEDAADPEPTAAPEPAPPWDEIVAFRKTATDAAWDRYADGLEGAAVVNWPGEVVDLKEESSGFEVLVDFNPDDPLSVQDAYIPTTDEEAIMWPKGSAVVVNGIIERADSFMGAVTLRFEDGVTIALAP